MSNVTHLPPSWSTHKDRNHPAWWAFMDYMKWDNTEPTPILWTLWRAAYGRGVTDEMKRIFSATGS